MKGGIEPWLEEAAPEGMEEDSKDADEVEAGEANVDEGLHLVAESVLIIPIWMYRY